MTSALRAQARGQTVATRPTPESGGEGSLAQQLRAMEPEFARVLPASISAERMTRIALTVLRGNDELMKAANANPASFFGALLTASQLGLEPGPLGECALIAYKNVVTFQPQYKGLLKLAWNSGAMSSFTAQTVHENDEFDYQRGLHPDLVHRPAPRDRGEITYVYAVAIFKDGASVFEVMSTDEVNKHRFRYSKQPNGPAWTGSWPGMALKTVVIKLTKWLPRSTESMELLHRAAAMDDSVRTDIAPLAVAQVRYAELEDGSDVEQPAEPAEEPPPVEPAPAVASRTRTRAAKPAAPVETVNTETGEITTAAPASIIGPDGIGYAQLGRLQELFKKAGLDGDAARNLVVDVIGRPVTEPGQMTGVETDRVIAALEAELVDPAEQDAFPAGDPS